MDQKADTKCRNNNQSKNESRNAFMDRIRVLMHFGKFREIKKNKEKNACNQENIIAVLYRVLIL